jgi:dethiobiotin synthetase
MQAGQRVLAVKPVEVGCDGRRPEAEDGALLAAATGQAAPRSALIRFGAPLPPALASGPDAEAVDFDALLLQLEPLRPEADVVLLEGTGGLLTPVTWEWNAVELARSLGAGALVVGSDRDETLNQMLLTLSALELGGVDLHGVVLTTPGAAEPSTGLNAGAISRLSGLDRVLAVERESDPLAAAERGALSQVADWLG